MLITHDASLKRFVFCGTFEEREVPKSARFQWDSARRQWWTGNHEQANELRCIADNHALCAIDDQRGKAAAWITASGARDAAIDIPCPPALAYMPFQKAGIAYCLARPACLIADSMGLGKTIQAIGVINAVENIRRVLVVCPASLKINWKRELGKWLVRPMSVTIIDTKACDRGEDILVVNYDILTRLPWLSEIDWDMVVMDECFPYNTEIMTERGLQKIGDVVELKSASSVLSFDFLYNEFIFKPIVRRIKIPQVSTLIKIRHEGGELICTQNHKIWTEKGYVRAEEISNNDYLCMVQEAFPKKKEGSVNSKILFAKLQFILQHEQSFKKRKNRRCIQKTACYKDLSVVQGKIPHSRTWANCSKKTVLLNKVFGLLEKYVAGHKRTTQKKWSPRRPMGDREKKTGYVRKDENKECRPCIPSKNRRRKPSPKGEIVYRKTWRAGIHYRTSANTLASTWSWLGNGIPDQNCANTNDVSESSAMVCSRYRQPPKNGCRRSGWKFPPMQKMEISGQTQTIRTRNVRVESVEILEQGNHAGSQNGLVYNLDIRDTHNYIANGILVSNCHKIKNLKALRTRAAHQLHCRRRLILTGTPILNRPAELFSLLKWLDPIAWPSFRSYATRFCAAWDAPWGWDTSGASNLDELNRLLRGSLMVRRLKEDVLPELPAKRRAIIELPANGRSRSVTTIIQRELAAWNTHEALQAKLRTLLDGHAPSCPPPCPDTYREQVAALRAGIRVAFEDMARLRHETAVAKIPQVIEHLQGCLESGEKIVCYAWHHDVINAIMEAFPDISVRLDGRMNVTDRQRSVDRFQATGNNIRLFVGNIQTAGVGLTLTASSHAVFAELDWVPGNVSQAEDRLHRIGQRDSVLIQHLVLENSLDCRIAKTIIDKQDTIDEAVGESHDGN